MDVRKIMEILPHRYPFILVDRIQEIVPGKSAVGIKNVTINEEFFQGHFPGHPVMPGVLILEFLAQVAAVLAFVSAEDTDNPGGNLEESVFYFMSMDRVKFRRPVVPGDRIRGEVTFTRNRGTMAGFQGKAYVEDSLVAEAEMKAMIIDREKAASRAAEGK